MRVVCVIVLALAVIAGEGVALAQTGAEQGDHKWVYSLGWTGDWSRDEGMRFGGATAGVEINPIENWLSIEPSVSAIYAKHATEMPIEVAFRKPWQLTPQVELMAGVAPEVVRRFGPGGETFGGVSFGAHVMVWPRRNIGWFAESAYELVFPRDGTERGVSLSAGLLIGR
jgi:hypothetical protein